jgi:hypothetical protein
MRIMFHLRARHHSEVCYLMLTYVNVSELPRASQGGQTPRRCGDGAEEEEAGEAGGGPEQKLRQDMGM